MRGVLATAALLVLLSTVAACGRTRTVVSVQTVTVRTLPGISPRYADPVFGVHFPLTLAQLTTIQGRIARASRDARHDPDIEAPIANVELRWEVGDPIRAVRVVYTYFCAHVEGIGYEEVRMDERGRETMLSSALGFDPQVGQLCVTPN